MFTEHRFTHHQKTVVVSSKDEASGKQRVQAFVGGLDLTDGRYDNLDFSLFRTLKSIHAAPDFWQACALQTGAESGPREPWRDIHMKVEGAAAWDVMENFTTRWARQAKGELHDVSDSEFMSVDEELGHASGGWNVQLLRSINQCSAELNAYRPGLVARHSALVDHSIHDAYIHAIRRAKSHIYIENQYFLGSSHMWDPETGERGGFATHLVAIELAEKICAKIRAGERFAAYVVVPMYPEGPPDSAAVQQILSHQKRTVSMITQRIAAALAEMGGEGEIGDYFNLFCLTNRESPEGGMGNGGETAQEKTLSASRRFMIYVHSKFAIFDDAVAIIGSANINSRSMDGSRDSEIATMSWQSDHLATGPNGYGQEQGEETVTPKGDIAAFRCGIWTTLLGGYAEEWENPASLECVRKVRKLSQANWANFARKGGDPADMPHGFMSFYPYHYDPVSGEAMPSTEHFPDFPAAAVGGKLGALPLMLTG